MCRVERTADCGQGAVVERPVDSALPVAWAGHGQVDGEEDGAEPGVDRLRDQLRGNAVVAKDVHLQEPRAARRSGGDIGRARRGEGREAEGRTDRRCGAGKTLLPIRMRHPLVRHRRDDDGRGDGVAEHGRLRRGRLDPAEHALAQAPFGERGHVLAQRPLDPGAAGEELGPVGIHSRERERFDIRERERRLHRAIISGTGTI